MATNPLSGAFSGGAVVINTQPLAAMYHQYARERQAKEDALDNYFRDLGKNITPAGMRSQDVPGLTQKTNAWQQYYQQNKPQILNPRLDNGKAYSEYMARYQDQLAHIQQSKDALKTTDELNKTRLNPATSFILDDPNIIDQIHQHDLPIGDPNRKELNLATLTIPPKPYDVKDWENYQKYRTYGLKKDETYGQTQFLPGFKTLTPVTNQYNNDTLMKIGERGKAMYDTDRSLQSETNKLMRQIERDPARQQQLNSVYKKIYGRDIESARDLRAAQDILEESAKSIEYKPGEDVFGREKAIAAIHHGYTEDEIRLREDLKNKNEDEQNNLIDEKYNEVKQDALNNPRPYKPVKGEPYSQYSIKATEPMLKMFAVKDAKGHLIYPDELRYSKDQKYVVPVFMEHLYDKDKNGKATIWTPSIAVDDKGNASVDPTLSKPILESEFKERWKKELLGVSGYNKSLKGTTKPKTESNIERLERLRQKYY